MDPPDSTDFNLDSVIFDQKSNGHCDIDVAFIEEFLMNFSNTGKMSEVGRDQQSDADPENSLDFKKEPGSPNSYGEVSKPFVPVIGQVSTMIEKLKQQTKELKEKTLQQECELVKYEERLSEKMSDVLKLQMELDASKIMLEKSDCERSALETKYAEKEAELKQFKSLLQKKVNDDEEIQGLKKELNTESRLLKKTEKELERNTELLQKKSESLTSLKRRSKKLVSTLLDFGVLLKSLDKLSSKQIKYLKAVELEFQSESENPELTDGGINGENCYVKDENTFDNVQLNNGTVNGEITVKSEENSSFYNGEPMDSLCNDTVLKTQKNEPFVKELLHPSSSVITSTPMNSRCVQTGSSHTECPANHRQDGKNQNIPPAHSVTSIVLNTPKNEPFVKELLHPSSSIITSTPMNSHSVQTGSSHTERPADHRQNGKIQNIPPAYSVTNELLPDPDFLLIGSKAESVCSEDFMDVTYEDCSYIISEMKGNGRIPALSPMPPSPSPKHNSKVPDCNENIEKQNTNQQNETQSQTSNDSQRNLLKPIDAPPKYTEKRNVLHHQTSRGFEPRIEMPANNSIISNPTSDSGIVSDIALPPNFYYLSSTRVNNTTFINSRGPYTFDFLLNVDTGHSVCAISPPESSNMSIQSTPNTSISDKWNSSTVQNVDNRMSRIMSYYQASEKNILLKADKNSNTFSPARKEPIKVTDQSSHSQPCNAEVRTSPKRDSKSRLDPSISVNSGGAFVMPKKRDNESVQTVIKKKEHFPKVESQMDDNQSFVTSSCDSTVHVTVPHKNKSKSCSLDDTHKSFEEVNLKKSLSCELSNSTNSKAENTVCVKIENSILKNKVESPQKIVEIKQGLPENSDTLDVDIKPASNASLMNSDKSCWQLSSVPEPVYVSDNIQIEKQSECSSLNGLLPEHLIKKNFTDRNNTEQCLKTPERKINTNQENNQTDDYINVNIPSIKMEPSIPETIHNVVRSNISEDNTLSVDEGKKSVFEQQCIPSLPIVSFNKLSPSLKNTAIINCSNGTVQGTPKKSYLNVKKDKIKRQKKVPTSDAYNTAISVPSIEAAASASKSPSKSVIPNAAANGNMHVVKEISKPPNKKLKCDSSDLDIEAVNGFTLTPKVAAFKSPSKSFIYNAATDGNTHILEEVSKPSNKKLKCGSETLSTVGINGVNGLTSTAITDSTMNPPVQYGTMYSRIKSMKLEKPSDEKYIDPVISVNSHVVNIAPSPMKIDTDLKNSEVNAATITDSTTNPPMHYGKIYPQIKSMKFEKLSDEKYIDPVRSVNKHAVPSLIKIDTDPKTIQVNTTAVTDPSIRCGKTYSRMKFKQFVKASDEKYIGPVLSTDKHVVNDAPSLIKIDTNFKTSQENDNMSSENTVSKPMFNNVPPPMVLERLSGNNSSQKPDNYVSKISKNGNQKCKNGKTAQLNKPRKKKNKWKKKKNAQLRKLKKRAENYAKSHIKKENENGADIEKSKREIIDNGVEENGFQKSFHKNSSCIVNGSCFDSIKIAENVPNCLQNPLNTNTIDSSAKRDAVDVFQGKGEKQESSPRKSFIVEADIHWNKDKTPTKIDKSYKALPNTPLSNEKSLIKSNSDQPADNANLTNKNDIQKLKSPHIPKGLFSPNVINKPITLTPYLEFWNGKSDIKSDSFSKSVSHLLISPIKSPPKQEIPLPKSEILANGSCSAAEPKIIDSTKSFPKQNKKHKNHPSQSENALNGDCSDASKISKFCSTDQPEILKSEKISFKRGKKQKHSKILANGDCNSVSKTNELCSLDQSIIKCEKYVPKENGFNGNEHLLEHSLSSDLNKSVVENGHATLVNNNDENYLQIQVLEQNNALNSCQNSVISDDEHALIIAEDFEEENSIETKITIENTAKPKKKKKSGVGNAQKKLRISKEESSSNVLSIAKALCELEKLKFDQSHFRLRVHTLVNALINPANASDTVSVLFKIIRRLADSRRMPLLSFSISKDTSALIPCLERYIVSALIQVDQKMKSHLKGLLSSAEHSLYLLVLSKNNIPIYGLCAFCRVLTEICKYTENSKKPIMLCCDLLKMQHKWAPYLIASIVSVWPELFAVPDGTSDVEMMFQSAIAYGVEKKPLSMTDNQWKHCGVIFSKFLMASSIPDVDETANNFKRLINTVLKEEKPCETEYMLTDPLVIFSASEGWTWTQDHLLNDFILPSLEKYARVNANERAFTLFCELYSEIGLLSPDCKEPIEYLWNFFIHDKASDYVKTTAARSLLKLFLLKNQIIPGCLSEWVEENQTNLTKLSIELLLRRRLMSDSCELTEEDIFTV